MSFGFRSEAFLDLGGNFTDWESDESDLTADAVVEGGDGGISNLLLSKVQLNFSTGLKGDSLIAVFLFESLLGGENNVSGLGEVIHNFDLLVGVESLLGLDDGINVEEIVGSGHFHARDDDFIDKGFSQFFASNSLEGGLDTLLGESLLNDGSHILNDILGDIDFHLHGVVSVRVEVVTAWLAVGFAGGVDLSKHTRVNLDGLGSGEEKSEGKVESHDDSVLKKFLFFVLQREAKIRLL